MNELDEMNEFTNKNLKNCIILAHWEQKLVIYLLVIDHTQTIFYFILKSFKFTSKNGNELRVYWCS